MSHSFPEWQPIETAPKPGTWILAGEFGSPDLVGDYYAACWVGDEDGYWCANCGQFVTQTPEPTHWMPLPPPPVSTQMLKPIQAAANARETVAAIVGDAIYGPTRRDTYRHVTLPCADRILAALTTAPEPGADSNRELVEALRPFARAAKWWQAFHDFHRITSLHQHGDCLEVRHLRDASAALEKVGLSEEPKA